MINRVGEFSFLILAGGLGTRLGNITKQQPKAMVLIKGKPFIEHQLNLLRALGARKVVLSIGYLGDQIQELVGNGSNFGLEVLYKHDGEQPLGTGGAVKSALPLVTNPCFVTYGDTLLPTSYEPLIDTFNGHASMMVFKNVDNLECSNATFDGINVIYNKTDPDPMAEFVDYGISLISHSAFEQFDGKFDLAEVLETLSKNKRLVGALSDIRFYEIGNVDSLAEIETLDLDGILQS